jgi:tRNA pseudouridine55 synthase
MTTGMKTPVNPDSIYQKGTLLLVDKPLNWTSFDVVAKLRNRLSKCCGKIKVGHSGTLDPKATGLLVIATGKMTKKIPELEVLDKDYIGTIRLGERTKSLDTETEVYDRQPLTGLSEEMILETAKSFLGQQTQVPPMFSAGFSNGQRLYDIARKGGDVPNRKGKSIEVFEFRIISIAADFSEIAFFLKVSKGTYIRTIASDFGDRLVTAASPNGCGAYLTSLRRTRIGTYHLHDAKTVETLIAELDQEAASQPTTEI